MQGVGFALNRTDFVVYFLTVQKGKSKCFECKEPGGQYQVIVHAVAEEGAEIPQNTKLYKAVESEFKKAMFHGKGFCSRNVSCIQALIDKQARQVNFAI